MVFELPMWWMIIFCVVYFIRAVLIHFFVNQVEAEKTRDALTQILNNLPNAVLMLESNQLSYCNRQADSFFGTELSQLTTDEIQKSQYLLMGNRCLHQLKDGAVTET